MTPRKFLFPYNDANNGTNNDANNDATNPTTQGGSDTTTTVPLSVSLKKTPLDQKSTEGIATDTKKNISYLFQLETTKKQLDEITKKILKQQDSCVSKQNSIESYSQEILQFKNEYNALIVQFKEAESVFFTKMTFYGLSDEQIISDATVQEKFIASINNEEKESWYNTLDYLTELYLEKERKSALLSYVQHELIEMQNLLKESTDSFTQDKQQLDALLEDQNTINMEGFLKSIEYTGPKVSLEDFISSPAIEQQFKKLIALYQHQKEMIALGISLPKGILFFGERETGKTFSAKLLASAIDRKMYHIKAQDLFSEDVNDPNAMLHTIFYSIIDHVQKTNEPCIIFLDEVEKMILSMGDYSSPDQKIITNTLIKNIINIQKSDLDIIIVAGVGGEKGKIDPRLLKYDMFDSQFYFELPGNDERKRLFSHYIDKTNKQAKKNIFSSDVMEGLDDLVKKTEKFSAEYIKQIIAISLKEYLYRKIVGGAKPSLIDKEFLLSKIDELRLEDKKKGTTISY